MLDAFGAAVQNSAFGLWAAGSPLAYPVANTLHLLGLVMLVGAIGLLDLRLAGAFRSLPPAPLSKALTPVAIAGLILMLPTGAILFAADAAALVQSDIFLRKVVLIMLALANALAFRWMWADRIERWDDAPPSLGRAMAVLSILLWLAIGGLGRWIAYG